MKIPLHVKRYGLHRVALRLRDSEGLRTRTRALAYLHPDTRERGSWDESKGLIFGYWDWRGGHETPTGVPQLQVMADAGAEAPNRSFERQGEYPWDAPPSGTPLYSEAEKEYARSRSMMSRPLIAHSFFVPDDPGMLGVKWDFDKPEEMEKAVVKAVRRFLTPLGRADHRLHFVSQPAGVLWQRALQNDAR